MFDHPLATWTLMLAHKAVVKLCGFLVWICFLNHEKLNPPAGKACPSVHSVHQLLLLYQKPDFHLFRAFSSGQNSCGCLLVFGCQTELSCSAPSVALWAKLVVHFLDET